MKPGEIRGAERERLWRRVMLAWRVRPQEYWYPLAEGAGLDLLAFKAPYFDEALLAGRQLHAILAGRAIEHVFELLEGWLRVPLPRNALV